MYADIRAAADGRTLRSTRLPKVSRLAASATNRFRNSVGGDSPARIQPTQRGATQRSVAMRIIWRLSHLPKAWRDWRTWGVASGPQSCARRPSGGGVTGRSSRTRSAGRALTCSISWGPRLRSRTLTPRPLALQKASSATRIPALPDPLMQPTNAGAVRLPIHPGLRLEKCTTSFHGRGVMLWDTIAGPTAYLPATE